MTYVNNAPKGGVVEVYNQLGQRIMSTIATSVIAAIALLGAFLTWYRSERYRRAEFIRSYRLPLGMYDKLRQHRPELSYKDCALIAHALRPEVPSGMVLVIGPLGLAAWFGFLVTALNLMPVGQLDGGHVAYAILRRRAVLVSRFAQVMGLVLLWFSPLWLVWMLVMLVIGKRHPPTLADHRPVGRGRVLIGLIGLVVFALCFTPRPLLISWSDFVTSFRQAVGF